MHTWIVGVATAAVVLGAWEMAARRAGFVPSVSDDVRAWTLERGRVTDTSTVVVGTSRAQADLDLRVWADVVGGLSPVNLAIAGGSVMPVMEDLADMESFRGTVLVDFIPRIEFDATRHREEYTKPYLVAYEEMSRSPARFAEGQLRSLMPGLAFKSAGLSAHRVLRSVGAVLRGTRDRVLPDPPYFVIRRDRYMRLDFSRVDLDRRVEVLKDQISGAGRPAEREEIDEILDRLRRSVTRIEDRGGRVILVHFPHSGEIKMLEELEYPRERYWDRLDELGAGETLFTGDHPSLAAFDCPDGSHLDTRDSGPFTRALVALVDPAGRRGRKGTVGGGRR